MNPQPTFQLHDNFPKSGAAFLQKAQWGDASLRFKVSDYGALLRAMPGFQMASLQRNGRWIAAAGFWTKRMLLKGQVRTGVYCSGLLVLPAERGKGLGRQLLEQSQSAMAEELTNPIFYTHVEAKNLPSQKIFRSLGFKPVAPFGTLALIHRSPRFSLDVTVVRPSEKQKIVRLLRLVYRRHNFFDLQSFAPQRYWLLRKNGHLIAGLQAQDRRYRVGRTSFRFLKVGNIFLKPRQEAAWWELLESVLARHHRTVANLYFDPRDPACQILLRSPGKGFRIDSFKGLQLLASCPGQPRFLSTVSGPVAISPNDE